MQRHLYKMKPRTQFLITIGLLILIIGITWISFSTRNQEPTQVYNATINRDCAPWDGAAFTVSVPIERSVINISIYQSPDIKLPITFSFPDSTLRFGNTYLLRESGLPEQLIGKVSFKSVKEGRQVEGQFDLVTNADEHFKGKFIAEWGNEIIYCG